METLKDNEMWFLCREPFYDLDSLDSAMTDIANKQGKDSIVTVLTEKIGILKRRSLYILMYWAKVNKPSLKGDCSKCLRGEKEKCYNIN